MQSSFLWRISRWKFPKQDKKANERTRVLYNTTYIDAAAKPLIDKNEPPLYPQWNIREDWFGFIYVAHKLILLPSHFHLTALSE